MRVSPTAVAILLSWPIFAAPALASPPAGSPKAIPPAAEKTPPPSSTDEGDGADDSNLDAVQADDAVGIQEDLNEGKKELEELLKTETQAIDRPDTTPKHLNRLGPGNPLSWRAFEANRGGGDLFDAAQPAPEGDAGGMLAELNGLDIGALKAEYDIPIEINDDVIEYIRFFQGPGRKWYTAWLARSHRWIPLMRPILAEEGLPLDLVYLAMIESGFSPFAYSWARASGFWQFIGETGCRYGLRDDFWVDERRDPVLATRAAARFLKSLHDDLGDWYLAWASYNAGEAKIRHAMKLYHSSDFWHLAHAGRYLRQETKHYVPKLIAAAIIAKHPERFGFADTGGEAPFEYDEVEIPDATDLQVVAGAAHASMDAIQQMNPELRRWCTPAGHDGQGYRIRIPPGTKSAFLTAIDQLEPANRLTFRYHRVARGESIAAIARAFTTDAGSILKMNGIASPKALRPGTDLIIPVSAALAQNFPDRGTTWTDPEAMRRRHRRWRHHAAYPTYVAYTRRPDLDTEGIRVVAARGGARAGSSGGATRRYVVRGGDSLWSIARKFGVEVEELRRWNGIGTRGAHGLQIGRTLRVSAPAKAETAMYRKGRG